jgi:signal transduction histidine kinase
VADHAAGDHETLTRWTFWLGSWSWVPGYVLVPTVLLLLLPDGRAQGRAGRGLVRAGCLGATLTTLAWAVTPYDEQDAPPPARHAQLTNPVGIDGAGLLLPLSLGLLALCVVGALALLVVRLRRARGREREQAFWAWAGALLTVLLLAAGFVVDEAADLLVAVAMVPLPAAVTWSSVRRRLWDLDLAVNRTLVLVALATAGAAAFAALAAVTAGGAPAPVLAAAATVLVVPFHGRVQDAVNRFLYDDDADEPFAAVRRLGEQVGAATTPEEALQRVLDMTAATLAADGVEVRLPDGGLLRVGDGRQADHVVPLLHHHTDVGELALAVPAEGLGARGEHLLADLSRHAAAAAHAVALQRAVQRSREEVVMAREEERRRLRNDLHDDLGPGLAATALQIENATEIVPEDPRRAIGVLERASQYLRTSVADVRRIVDDLRPPALDELGLVQAVREHAARLEEGGLRVTVAARGNLEALPAAAEVATYRIVAEAMTNVARHAGASRLDIVLDGLRDGVRITVVDDGNGLPDDVALGVGLRSMHQRAAELGGHCLVRGRPGSGTTVTAMIPAATR